MERQSWETLNPRDGQIHRDRKQTETSETEKDSDKGRDPEIGETQILIKSQRQGQTEVDRSRSGKTEIRRPTDEDR